MTHATTRRISWARVARHVNPSTTSGRAQILLLAGAFAICLIAVSPQRLVGDGREYLAQAIEFAALPGPALRPGGNSPIPEKIAPFFSCFSKKGNFGSPLARGQLGRRCLPFLFF